MREYKHESKPIDMDAIFIKAVEFALESAAKNVLREQRDMKQSVPKK